MAHACGRGGACFRVPRADAVLSASSERPHLGCSVSSVRRSAGRSFTRRTICRLETLGLALQAFGQCSLLCACVWLRAGVPPRRGLGARHKQSPNTLECPATDPEADRQLMLQLFSREVQMQSLQQWTASGHWVSGRPGAAGQPGSHVSEREPCSDRPTPFGTADPQTHTLIAHPNLQAMRQLGRDECLHVLGTFIQCDGGKHLEYAAMVKTGWRSFFSKRDLRRTKGCTR